MNSSESVKNISFEFFYRTVNLELVIDPVMCPLLYKSIIRLDKQKNLLGNFNVKNSIKDTSNMS